MRLTSQAHIARTKVFFRHTHVRMGRGPKGFFQRTKNGTTPKKNSPNSDMVSVACNFLGANVPRAHSEDMLTPFEEIKVHKG